MKKVWLVSVFTFGMLAFGATPRSNASRDSLELLTPQEAARLGYTKSEWEEEPDADGTRALEPTDGPAITFENPEVRSSDKGPLLVVKTPADLVVEFKQTKSPVDMASLDVSAKKGIFSKSLTDRLKPYVKENRLEAKNVEVPKGQFKIIVSIADTTGHISKEEYALKVE